MILTVIAALAVAGESYSDSMPGTIFPKFDIEEHCRLMSLSSLPHLVHMSKTCTEREIEYKAMAQDAWASAVDSDRAMCEITALSGIGSYQVLATCLLAQTSQRILLKMPLRDKQ